MDCAVRGLNFDLDSGNVEHSKKCSNHLLNLSLVYLKIGHRKHLKIQGTTLGSI
jgi:hypothetical protein